VAVVAEAAAVGAWVGVEAAAVGATVAGAETDVLVDAWTAACVLVAAGKVATGAAEQAVKIIDAKTMTVNTLKNNLFVDILFLLNTNSCMGAIIQMRALPDKA
jgi:hypothetical protein